VKILVLNAGSSSIKFQLFDMKDIISIASGIIEQIGENNSHIVLEFDNKKVEKKLHISNHQEALEIASSLLKENNILKDMTDIDAVGHRVVHGGEYFNTSVLIDTEVEDKIKSLIPLAPLHNGANLSGIKIAREKTKSPQIAVFDTAFHQSMPSFAYHYALPYSMYKNLHIRRYGFHGTSHHFVSKQASKILSKDNNKTNLITIHLGNGASVCAIKNGASVDTSMGLTPLEGLVMGTRCGDIDPAIIAYIANSDNKNIQEIDTLLNKQSGLKGICGHNDMREIIELSQKNDKKAILALDMFCYRVKKYIGSYIAVLGEVDAIVFTGGIGEHSSIVRAKVCENMLSLGLEIDTSKNDSFKDGIISSENSKIKIMLIPTNEELEIAMSTKDIIENIS
jgi:acetate kinase